MVENRILKMFFGMVYMSTPLTSTLYALFWAGQSAFLNGKDLLMSDILFKLRSGCGGRCIKLWYRNCHFPRVSQRLGKGNHASGRFVNYHKEKIQSGGKRITWLEIHCMQDLASKPDSVLLTGSHSMDLNFTQTSIICSVKYLSQSDFRFRRDQLALSADIREMFLQVQMQSENKNGCWL